MERITMSTKERRRLTIIARVQDKHLSLREASEMMKLSYRQGKRIWQRYRLEGDSGLVHKGRGRASNRMLSADVRKQAIRLYRKHYPDFGPMLAGEHLAQDHNLVLDHETLRRWLITAGLWKVKQNKPTHRAARERRPRRGDLVQMDGSDHDWFEGRGPKVVLMVMIDDATNITFARFYPAEDTVAAFDIFERYVRLYGLPAALYPDRDSIYICTREANIDEQLADIGPETQFARAMRELKVDLIPAYSPQAKGRVERRHGVFQDRLVKEMRLKKICTIEAANAYLDDAFLAFLNGRYTVKPRDPVNGHQPRPSANAMAFALSWKETRSVAKDWTVRWRNRRFQIDARHTALDLPGRRVTFIERRDGSLAIQYHDRLLTFRDAPQTPIPVKRAEPPHKSSLPRRPPVADHPWRRYRIKHRQGSRPPPTSNKAHSRGAEPLAKTTSNQIQLTA